MIDEKPIKLFIYGNMSSGRHCHTALVASGARYEHSAIVKGYQLYNTFSGLPAALPEADAELVGELYSCSPEALRRSDELMVGTNFIRIAVVAIKTPRVLQPFECMPKIRNEDVAWTHIFRNPKPENAKRLVSIAELDRDNYLVN
jgi:gamma-glutamylcyclotransferase (GGCT)/AIG2-like uncharacterized protein YtfP